MEVSEKEQAETWEGYLDETKDFIKTTVEINMYELNELLQALEMFTGSPLFETKAMMIAVAPESAPRLEVVRVGSAIGVQRKLRLAAMKMMEENPVPPEEGGK